MEKSISSEDQEDDVSRHREAFEELAEEAEKELEDSLKKLVLYGSVARGEENEASDVDVFAVVENKAHKRWIQQRGAEIGVEHGLMMSVIVKTEDEYKEMGESSFWRSVMEEGEAYV